MAHAIDGVTSYDTMSQAVASVGRDPSVLERLGVRVWVERGHRDPMPWLSVAAVVGLSLGAALAVFGMPPVDLHAPPHHYGIMDPFCGMTRGSAATMRGDLAKAWWYNPGSPFVILGGLMVVARWVVGRLTGRWMCARWRLTRLSVTVTVLLLLVLEIHQQLHVDRLV